MIEVIGQSLRLSPSVQVDMHDVSKVAGEVAAGMRAPSGLETKLVEDLRQDLLPEWPEDWLSLERDRWDQLRLHALEALAQQLQAIQQYVPALQTALAAVAIDPARETAHRIVMEVHISEGNVASALKCYQQYRNLLEREFNISPSPQMKELVEELMPR
ncbi:bacterial transcriptional activator domain-containing protein [Streptomyces sp. NPDC093546]|uniref:bacterial transcriptional activator domain-containing protein n=1 Tax=Streptomyces sp. NPDC093546 TaxID=3366040 RepID=UPI00381BBD4F